jgi:hypothetical protein
MPQLVEPPKIQRPNAGPRGSKYVTDEALADTVKLLTENAGTGWVGGLFAPVDTIIKARGALSQWREALAKSMGLEIQAFATRVWETDKIKVDGKEVKQFLTAIALKQGALEAQAEKDK